jgi:hypothetical protein
LPSGDDHRDVSIGLEEAVGPPEDDQRDAFDKPLALDCILAGFEGTLEGAEVIEERALLAGGVHPACDDDFSAPFSRLTCGSPTRRPPVGGHHAIAALGRRFVLMSE